MGVVSHTTPHPMDTTLTGSYYYILLVLFGAVLLGDETGQR